MRVSAGTNVRRKLHGHHERRRELRGVRARVRGRRIVREWGVYMPGRDGSRLLGYVPGPRFGCDELRRVRNSVRD